MNDPGEIHIYHIQLIQKSKKNETKEGTEN